MMFLFRAGGGIQLENFIHLKNGDMILKEYVNQFNALAGFGMELINTPHKKAVKFA